MGDLDSFPIYGGLGKKEGGGVFEEGGLIPQCILWNYKISGTVGAGEPNYYNLLVQWLPRTTLM